MKNTLVILLLSVAFVFGSLQTASASTKVYVVQSGDSLWEIAKQFKVSFRDILSANKNLKDIHLIFPNQKIVMPSGAGTNTSTESHNDNVPQGNSTETQGSTSSLEVAVLDLVNKERAKQGLNALKMSQKLVNLAEMKAKDMADKNYFSHTSPTYGTPFEMLQKYGVSYRSAGENIASGQKSAEAVMNDWMNSSGHRANILNASYTEIGVGYYKGGRYGTEWVQLFIGN